MWGDCSPSAIIDCQMVPPMLNPFLADVPGIQGIDGSEMLEVDRAMMRDLPYSEPLTCHSMLSLWSQVLMVAMPAESLPRLGVYACQLLPSRDLVSFCAAFPAGWDCLVENVIDPSHVNWSHHNHIGERQVQLLPFKGQFHDFTAASLLHAASP